MEFSDHQRLFLATICTHFHTTGQWLTYGLLDRKLRGHKSLDVQEVGKELDRFMYDGPHAPPSGWDPTRETYLSISALHTCQSEGICPELFEDLDALMQVVHLCIERYEAGEEDSPITEAEVRDRFKMSDLILRKVFLLVGVAGLTSAASYEGSNPSEPMNWSFTVFWIIRKYRDVATIQDYLAVRQKLVAQATMPTTSLPMNASSELIWVEPASILGAPGVPDADGASDTREPPTASLNTRADVDGVSPDTPQRSDTEDLDDPYEYLWDGQWQTTHHRIMMGDDLAVHPAESEGNAVTTLIHQFVSALAAKCERQSTRLEELTPFGSFSYIAVVTPSLVEVVFGRSVHGRYAIHRDMRPRNTEVPIAELEETSRRKMGWTTTASLVLPSSLIAQAAEDRQDIIDVRADEVAETLLAKQSAAGRADLGALQPISLFPRGPFTRNERLCFVLMPFAEAMQSVYDDAIFPAATHLKLECRRADEISKPGGIMAQVWQSLMEARVVIADLTNMNPNVFYELGLAHVIGHEVILLTQNMKFVPFDLRHIRCFEYAPDQPGLRQLEQNLRTVIREVLAAPQGTA